MADTSRQELGTDGLSDREISFIDGMGKLAMALEIEPIVAMRLFGRMTQPMTMMMSAKYGTDKAQADADFLAAFREGMGLGMPTMEDRISHAMAARKKAH